MNIGNCNNGTHIWIFKDSQGALNEIITYKNINNLELERIKNGDNSLYPPEKIECKNCGILLNDNSKKKQNTPSIKQFKNIKIAE